MGDEPVRDGFDFYLRFAKPLVINLPEPNDRVLAAAWIQKLRNEQCGSEKLRTDYLKLLLFVLQKKRLVSPFKDNPNIVDKLPEFSEKQDSVHRARELLIADVADRRSRLRGMLTPGGSGAGDYPILNVECSADLREYAASQKIPMFGIHAYYAISRQPITNWNNADISYLPKGISAEKLNLCGDGAVLDSSAGGATSITNTSLHRSAAPNSIPSPTKPLSPKTPPKKIVPKPIEIAKTPEAISPFDRTKYGISPSKSPERFDIASSPIAQRSPIGERERPTWGSNLIDVTEPPNDGDFNLFFREAADYGRPNLFDDSIPSLDMVKSFGAPWEISQADSVPYITPSRPSPYKNASEQGHFTPPVREYRGEIITPPTFVQLDNSSPAMKYSPISNLVPTSLNFSGDEDNGKFNFSFASAADYCRTDAVGNEEMPSFPDESFHLDWEPTAADNSTKMFGPDLPASPFDYNGNYTPQNRKLARRAESPPSPYDYEDYYSPEKATDNEYIPHKEYIPPGTPKSQDIIDEVNVNLRRAEVEASPHEYYKKYPHRRTDMPTTPPIFSKIRSIREHARGQNYNPSQFGLSQNEEFTDAATFLPQLEYSPRKQTDFRRNRREVEQIFAGEEYTNDADLFTADSDIDLLDEELIFSQSPKASIRKARTVLEEIEDIKSQSPANSGIPLTTPRKSPSPIRKAQSQNINIEDEMAAMFQDSMPHLDDGLLHHGLLDVSKEKPKTPTRSPKRKLTDQEQFEELYKTLFSDELSPLPTTANSRDPRINKQLQIPVSQNSLPSTSRVIKKPEELSPMSRRLQQIAAEPLFDDAPIFGSTLTGADYFNAHAPAELQDEFLNADLMKSFQAEDEVPDVDFNLTPPQLRFIEETPPEARAFRKRVAEPLSPLHPDTIDVNFLDVELTLHDEEKHQYDPNKAYLIRLGESNLMTLHNNSLGKLDLSLPDIVEEEVQYRTPSPVQDRAPSPVQDRAPSPVRVRTPSPVVMKTPMLENDVRKGRSRIGETARNRRRCLDLDDETILQKKVDPALKVEYDFEFDPETVVNQTVRRSAKTLGDRFQVDYGPLPDDLMGQVYDYRQLENYNQFNALDEDDIPEGLQSPIRGKELRPALEFQSPPSPRIERMPELQISREFTDILIAENMPEFEDIIDEDVIVEEEPELHEDFEPLEIDMNQFGLQDEVPSFEWMGSPMVLHSPTTPPPKQQKKRSPVCTPPSSHTPTQPEAKRNFENLYDETEAPELWAEVEPIDFITIPDIQLSPIERRQVIVPPELDVIPLEDEMKLWPTFEPIEVPPFILQDYELPRNDVIIAKARARKENQNVLVDDGQQHQQQVQDQIQQQLVQQGQQVLREQQEEPQQRTPERQGFVSPIIPSDFISPTAQNIDSFIGGEHAPFEFADEELWGTPPRSHSPVKEIGAITPPRFSPMRVRDYSPSPYGPRRIGAPSPPRPPSPHTPTRPTRWNFAGQDRTPPRSRINQPNFDFLTSSPVFPPQRNIDISGEDVLSPGNFRQSVVGHEYTKEHFDEFRENAQFRNLPTSPVKRKNTTIQRYGKRPTLPIVDDKPKLDEIMGKQYRDFYEKRAREELERKQQIIPQDISQRVITDKKTTILDPDTNTETITEEHIEKSAQSLSEDVFNKILEDNRPGAQYNLFDDFNEAVDALDTTADNVLADEALFSTPPRRAMPQSPPAPQLSPDLLRMWEQHNEVSPRRFTPRHSPMLSPHTPRGSKFASPILSPHTPRMPPRQHSPMLSPHTPRMPLPKFSSQRPSPLLSPHTPRMPLSRFSQYPSPMLSPHTPSMPPTWHSPMLSPRTPRQLPPPRNLDQWSSYTPAGVPNLQMSPLPSPVLGWQQRLPSTVRAPIVPHTPTATIIVDEEVEKIDVQPAHLEAQYNEVFDTSDIPIYDENDQMDDFKWID